MQLVYLMGWNRPTRHKTRFAKGSQDSNFLSGFRVNEMIQLKYLTIKWRPPYKKLINKRNEEIKKIGCKSNNNAIRLMKHRIPWKFPLSTLRKHKLASKLVLRLFVLMPLCNNILWAIFLKTDWISQTKIWVGKRLMLLHNLGWQMAVIRKRSLVACTMILLH